MKTVGERAPDFTLPDQDGKPVTLSELLKERPVVLYFYPKDETPGCKREACAFRDVYQDFSAAGVEVLGVSDDTVESHREFADHHRLPFRLMSDVGGVVRRLYGVPRVLGILKGRVTLLIDRTGTVRHVLSSMLRFDRHAHETLAVARTLA